LILIDSTANPTKDWILQQFPNCCIFGYLLPAAMVQGRDGIYGKWLPEILQEPGMLVHQNIARVSLEKLIYPTL